MFQIIGIVLLFAMVFGSYAISGGKFDVITHAAPHELMAIGGAGIAAFLISNSVDHDEGHPGRPGQGLRRPQMEGGRTTRTCCRCCSS
jgi:chemotaxis protein MotA